NVRSGLAIALMDFESRRQELAAFTPERFARTEQTLQDITTEIEQGHVTVRDALLTQQTLIDAIQSQIEARRALCISAVRLARAAGYPFERGVK
ncbi:MAG TPA: hypothetical protein VL137_17965, partial [Polyangiaceae bacterium]|nr:hypothetical protein [Polyangiaceae bacterium]